MDKRWFTDENTVSLLIWLRLVRFYQRSNQLSNDYLEQYGITVNQFDTLAQILVHQPVTQMELAEHMMITRGGVSHMLSRLEQQGFISRKQDWKVKYISLTDKGRTLIEKIMPLQSDFQASMFSDVLNDEEQQQLHEMMKKIHKHSLKKTIPQMEEE
ncbi:MarR family winged helix-turn-helix transcriptional regulator [Paenibacillus sp. FJAT-26967]|uniref:MarR family winged helix-turn-helix transcriptional regulator n=1 Tax=Paenibacillus sp. FJAT-26967 TaxID=1729690 RepID=UPI000838F09E|nr:MarR family winged helix-turn-helix transcriptional regulator [Paenibacillus sp. FJAT-26967]